MARVFVHVSDRSAGDENDFSDSAVRKPDRTFADQSYDKPAFLSRRKLDGCFSLLIVFFFFRAPELPQQKPAVQPWSDSFLRITPDCVCVSLHHSAAPSAGGWRLCHITGEQRLQIDLGEQASDKMIKFILHERKRLHTNKLTSNSRLASIWLVMQEYFLHCTS